MTPLLTLALPPPTTPLPPPIRTSGLKGIPRETQHNMPPTTAFFYAPLIVMPPQSNAARKIQAVHRGRLARKDLT
jgi:hypothetical protein